jgi:REP element-mobilizing transposase RayT
MPRTARASAANYCYHVLNRGNQRARVFHNDGDYESFVALLGEATVRVPMRTIAHCVMPNHFHLVVWPRDDGDLSRWMHWLLTAHVRRCLRHDRSSGHVWQGRFKAFPIQEDDHLRTVIRYVERNPPRAELVGRAEDWPWSSLNGIARGRPSPTLGPGPESARRRLGRMGQRTDDRGRDGAAPPERGARGAVRLRVVGRRDGVAAGAGVEPQHAGPKTGQGTPQRSGARPRFRPGLSNWAPRGSQWVHSSSSWMRAQVERLAS